MQTLEAPSLSTCGFLQGIYIGLLICRPSDESRLTRRSLLHAAAQKTHTRRDCGRTWTGPPVGGVSVYSDEDRAHYVERMWEGWPPHRGREAVGAPLAPLAGPVAARRAQGRLEVRARRPPHACTAGTRYPEETRGEALRLLGLGKPTRQIARMLGLRDGGASPSGPGRRLRAGGATMGAEAVDVEKATGGEGTSSEAEGRGRGAQGDAQRPKSREPGETLEQAEGRVGREVARGLRVPPSPAC